MIGFMGSQFGWRGKCRVFMHLVFNKVVGVIVIVIVIVMVM